jgi:hypothetical protein
LVCCFDGDSVWNFDGRGVVLVMNMGDRVQLLEYELPPGKNRYAGECGVIIKLYSHRCIIKLDCGREFYIYDCTCLKILGGIKINWKIEGF